MYVLQASLVSKVSVSRHSAVACVERLLLNLASACNSTRSCRLPKSAPWWSYLRHCGALASTSAWYRQLAAAQQGKSSPDSKQMVTILGVLMTEGYDRSEPQDVTHAEVRTMSQALNPCHAIPQRDECS